MEALLLGLLGLVVGTALSPLATTLAAWPEDESQSEARVDLPVPHSEAGFVRPMAVAMEHPLQSALLALTTGAVFAIAGLRYDDVGRTAILLAYSSVFLVCAATDLLSFRIPNAVTYPAIVGALAVAAFIPEVEVSEALAGGAMAGGLLLALSVATRGGIGLGDVKLATFAGLAIGWPFVLSALYVMALTGGLASILALLLRLRHRSDPLPYAPFIAAGAIAVMLWQGTIVHEL